VHRRTGAFDTRVNQGLLQRLTLRALFFDEVEQHDDLADDDALDPDKFGDISSGNESLLAGTRQNDAPHVGVERRDLEYRLWLG
jgi:hypothetical protein